MGAGCFCSQPVFCLPWCWHRGPFANCHHYPYRTVPVWYTRDVMIQRRTHRVVEHHERQAGLANDWLAHPRLFSVSSTTLHSDMCHYMKHLNGSRCCMHAAAVLFGMKMFVPSLSYAVRASGSGYTASHVLLRSKVAAIRPARRSRRLSRRACAACWQQVVLLHQKAVGHISNVHALATAAHRATHEKHETHRPKDTRRT